MQKTHAFKTLAKVILTIILLFYGNSKAETPEGESEILSAEAPASELAKPSDEDKKTTESPKDPCSEYQGAKDPMDILFLFHGVLQKKDEKTSQIMKLSHSMAYWIPNQKLEVNQKLT